LWPAAGLRNEARQASVDGKKKIGDTAHYRISGKYFTRNGLVDAAGVHANEGHKAFRGGGRIDWQLSDRDSLTFSGDLFLSKIRETSQTISPAAPFAPHTNTPGEFTGGHVLGRWARTFSPQSNMALKVYYDRFNREIFDMSERINTFDVDFQHNVAFGKKHDVVWELATAGCLIAPTALTRLRCATTRQRGRSNSSALSHRMR